MEIDQLQTESEFQRGSALKRWQTPSHSTNGTKHDKNNSKITQKYPFSPFFTLFYPFSPFFTFFSPFFTPKKYPFSPFFTLFHPFSPFFTPKKYPFHPFPPKIYPFPPFLTFHWTRLSFKTTSSSSCLLSSAFFRQRFDFLIPIFIPLLIFFYFLFNIFCYSSLHIASLFHRFITISLVLSPLSALYHHYLPPLLYHHYPPPPYHPFHPFSLLHHHQPLHQYLNSSRWRGGVGMGRLERGSVTLRDCSLELWRWLMWRKCGIRSTTLTNNSSYSSGGGGGG